MPSEVLVAIAVAFVFAAGANDGGALLAPGLRVPALSIPVSVAALSVGVVALPLLTNASVADALLTGVLPTHPTERFNAVAVGFVVAMIVVSGATMAGLPTSLLLAVIGGIAGAGVGYGLAVDWGAITRVLLIGLAAPVVSALLAFGVAHAWPTTRSTSYLATTRSGHIAAFSAQCIAYGANDGQKVFVLFLAANIAEHEDETIAWWVYPVVLIAFAGGVAIGLPRLARGFGNGLFNIRPTHTVTTEFTAAIAVVASAAVGAPVSMTQSIAGGMLGAGLRDTYRKVRWRAVQNLGLTWVFTLPAAFLLAGAACRAAALLSS